MLTLSCPDRTGIVARITTFLADIGGWITEAAYHSDDESGRFFTRQEIRADGAPFDAAELRGRFAVVARELAADSWQVTDTADRKTVVLLVSKEGHCLYELLSRWHSKEMRADIGVVIGNHTDLEPVARLFGLPFRHIPVPRDDAEAVRLYRLAAAKGNAWAQSELGLMYRNARGVPRDVAEALRWFKKSADAGDASGQANLGSMYAQGLGVTRDDVEAVRLYRLAAAQGNAWAQSQLDYMYREGRGIAQDDAEVF